MERSSLLLLNVVECEEVDLECMSCLRKNCGLQVECATR
jgi:hypothetical protein